MPVSRAEESQEDNLYRTIQNQTAKNPTARNYDGLAGAFDHFNRELFDGALPPCLITMQRKNRTYGFFAGGRFGTRDGEEITDEIALNPSYFKERTPERTLSTLVHEMVHLWQHHAGKPPRTCYHNKQWAGRMRAVGLIPSDTGAPGGKEVGQHVSHYIEPGGRFERSCATFMGSGFQFAYVERWPRGSEELRNNKAASKTRYTCPDCCLNAWAKPGSYIACGGCGKLLEVEAAEEAQEPSDRWDAAASCLMNYLTEAQIDELLARLDENYHARLARAIRYERAKSMANPSIYWRPGQ